MTTAGRDAAIAAVAAAITAAPTVRQLRDAGHLPSAAVPTMAQRLVECWPGLASRPDAAPAVFEDIIQRLELPELARLASEPLIEEGLTLLDTELLGIRAGDRGGALRELVRTPDAEALVDGLRAMGLAAGVVDAQGEQGSVDGRIGSGVDNVVVAVARDAATLAALTAAQRAIRRSTGEPMRRAVAEVGAILGYPPCCVDAFILLRDHADNRLLELSPFVRSEGPVDPLLMRMGGIALLSRHFPCRCDCEASGAAAARTLVHMDALLPGLGAAVRRVLSRPILTLSFSDHVPVVGRWTDGAFVLDAASPTPSRPCLRPGAAVTLHADHVAVTVGRDVTRLPARYPLVIVPGEPLHPACRAVLPALPEATATGGRGPAAVRDGASGALASTPVIAWLCGGEALPLPLARGYRVEEARPTDRGVELLARGAGVPELHLLVTPRSDDRPAYARTGAHSLSYRRPATPLPPTTLAAVMDALAAQIEERER